MSRARPRASLRWQLGWALWTLELGAAACALPTVGERAPDAGVTAGTARQAGAVDQAMNAQGAAGDRPSGAAGAAARPTAEVVGAGTAAGGGSSRLPTGGMPAVAGANNGGAAAPSAGSGAPPASLPGRPSADHTFAGWPMPDALPGSLVKPSYSSMERTVTDNVTQLVWQRKVPAKYEGCSGKSGDVTQDSCTWQEAKQYCASAALAGLLGGSGWRLPTKIELESILDETRFDPAIDSDAFPGTLSSHFWTATADVELPGHAWYISFLTGLSDSDEPATANYVRCVRDSSAAANAPAGRYETSADVVLDRNTGLSWQRNLPDRTYTWEAAKSACQSMGAPWRLPALKELLTLVDPTRTEPAIDAATFPHTASELFWTASPLVADTSKAWSVGFTYGNGYSDESTSQSHRVRCVR